ncbi:uncharacterized protein LOC128990012 [Macrosteles quadrilineatus]|uniref:uncharacterized protein LOC128990012 n=1 Tax=Macrosteles quadrilineatus TaxID=74068 RepID=UPI0023E2B9D7|nr:uncharacterized protein LOC128990012 [Macrosteles quadrilineatus]
MSNPQQCNTSPYFVCQVPQGNYNDSLCDPTRGISSNGTQTQQCVSPSPQECSPQHHNFSSISDCYIEDPYLPSPVLFPSFPSPCPPSPCPEVCSPQSQNPQGVCHPHTPVDYFGNPIGSQQTSPCWGSPPGAQNQVSTCPLEYNDLGELRRNRAPPGTFSGIDLVDCPGMGFPVPKAALDRGGRLPGQTVPLTPPPPPPPHMGRFTPLAISSPVKGDPGVLRPRQPVTPLPPNPLGEQPMDPALLPKIQEDLQKLAERNKNLQELVNNFKRIRATLTDAIDKAVKLNQKLQRDLYYVAEAHR